MPMGRNDVQPPKDEKENTFVEIELSEEILQKLQTELAKQIAKGTKLKNGKLIQTPDDLITLMLDFYEEKLKKKVARKKKEEQAAQPEAGPAAEKPKE